MGVAQEVSLCRSSRVQRELRVSVTTTKRPERLGGGLSMRIERQRAFARVLYTLLGPVWKLHNVCTRSCRFQRPAARFCYSCSHRQRNSASHMANPNFHI